MANPINRRAVLRGTVGASAVAAAGVTITTAAGAAHTDAVLSELEAEFNRILPNYLEAEKAAHAAQRAWYASGRHVNDPGMASYLAANSVVEAEFNRWSNALFAAEEAILATPAETTAGLAVKARFLRYLLNIEANPSPDRDDWSADEITLADFIAEAERLALAGRA